MSSRTREINKITMAIIRISVKLMLLALLILLLYEAVIRGYAFWPCGVLCRGSGSSSGS